MKLLKKLFKHDTIREYLRIWIILFTLIISLFILVPSFIINYHQMIKEQSKDMSSFLDGQTYFFESWLAERSNDIHSLANLDIVKEYNYPEAKAYFLEFRDKTPFADLIFVNKDGFVQFDTVDPNYTEVLNIDVRDRDYFKAAKAGTQPYITDILTSKVTNQPIIAIASPILDENQQFNGVVFGTINLATIDDLLYESRVGVMGQAYMVDKHGTLLSEFTSHGQEQANPNTISKNYTINNHILQSAKKQEMHIYKDANGHFVLGEGRAINNGNWYILSEVRLLEAYTPFLKQFSILIICILIGLLVAIRLKIYIAHKFEKPVQQLLHGVQYLKQGNYEYHITDKSTNAHIKEFRELMSAFNDMSSTVKEHTHLLADLSITCQLTNLYNRRYLMEQGEQIFNECKKESAPCPCIILDIDFFKKVNDTFGHTVGDHVLKHVASVITDSVRETDIVTRYGGEEFIILCPNTTLETSIKIAQRVSEEIKSHPYKTKDFELTITVSVGVAEYNSIDSEATFEGLINLADKALYEAKENGRNQIKVFNAIGNL